MTNERPLPDFLQKLIDNPPSAGSGVHDWMFNLARNLYAHMPAGQIENLLRCKLANCGRAVPDRELKAAVQNAAHFAWKPKPGSKAAETYNWSILPPPAPILPPPPKANLEKIESLMREPCGLADLWEASPIRIEDDDSYTEPVIDLLFPGDPLLCCGKSAAVFNTLPRSLWSGSLSSQAFLVPSPMSALTGLTKEGKESAHALSNTGPRRFLVIEFDFSEYARDGITPTEYQPMLRRLQKRNISVQDMCANLLLRLNRAVPMTLAVHSGGKSVHGWWYCLDQPDEQVKKFHDYARTLGADPATWRPSQFVRMPDGTRENGTPQTVYYFNPATLPNPILAPAYESFSA
jgi:hypothetical protein